MNTLESARQWRHLGIGVIPICRRSKTPAIESWKRYQSELPTSRQLEIWFESGRYNLAVITGWRGLAVLDWDDMWKYSGWLANMPTDQAIAILGTYQVRTARGLHLYFFTQEETQTVPNHDAGWDVKAAGGYVLGAPSVHPSGHIYKSLGEPSRIAEIATMWDLVKKPAPTISARVAQRDHRILDPFDAAMCDESAGISIADVNAAHSIYEIFGLTASQRRAMVKCPFHDDHHPSCVIYPDGGFKCFACGAHGDFVDFYGALKGLSVREVLKEMAA